MIVELKVAILSWETLLRLVAATDVVSAEAALLVRRVGVGAVGAQVAMGQVAALAPLDREITERQTKAAVVELVVYRVEEETALAVLVVLGVPPTSRVQ